MHGAVWFAAAAVTVVFAWQRIRGAETRAREMHERVVAAQVDAQHKEQQRQSERRGRVAAEQELRRVMGAKLNTSSGLFVQSLGRVHSCFRSCVGTPRQGLFAPSTRGKIVFERNISPDAFIGLEHFSHVWIVFEFHKNTNGKNARAHTGLRSDSHRFTFKAKISPPRLKKPVGVLSTRSPHRPNPIGITLAKIERVEARDRTVYISALDLIDGTPVLDIKPYVPAYDSVPSALIAPWVADDLSPTLHSIKWADPSLLQELDHLASTSQYYKLDATCFRAAIDEVLQVDVRSKDQTRKQRRAAYNHLVLDNARIGYRIVESREMPSNEVVERIEVVRVEEVSDVISSDPAVVL